MPLIKKRDSFFDNFKAVLIFFVVLGHILESFLNNSSFMFAYSIIYSFHMPAFVFVAGYFAKNIKKQEESVFFDFLIPYFFFNSLYQILLWRSLEINLFEPIYAYWFLLSMFFWKILLQKISQVRLVLLFLIIFSLYCGLFDNVSRYLSISRTFVFFPYFIIGYFCTE
jgi:fucose 4-O-acetylase-like acetyltransferase